MTNCLNAATASMNASLEDTTAALKQSLTAFSSTVDAFNRGVRDFSEFDYNLRGTVEKMDVAVRDLTTAIRRVTRSSERSDSQ
jgi:histidine ammonia-lyase